MTGPSDSTVAWKSGDFSPPQNACYAPNQEPQPSARPDLPGPQAACYRLSEARGQETCSTCGDTGPDSVEQDFDSGMYEARCGDEWHDRFERGGQEDCIESGDLDAVRRELATLFKRHGLNVGLGRTKKGVALRSQDERVDACNLGPVEAYVGRGGQPPAEPSQRAWRAFIDVVGADRVVKAPDRFAEGLKAAYAVDFPAATNEGTEDAS